MMRQNIATMSLIFRRGLSTIVPPKVCLLVRRRLCMIRRMLIRNLDRFSQGQLPIE